MRNKKLAKNIIYFLVGLIVFIWISENVNFSAQTRNTSLPPAFPKRNTTPKSEIVIEPVPEINIPPPETFTNDCLAKKGVVQMDYMNSFKLECKEFETGNVLQIDTNLKFENDYFRNVYPYASRTFPKEYINNLFFTYEPMTKNDVVIYKKNKGTLYEQGDDAIFYNTNFIEVALIESFYKNLISNQWIGTWYDMVQGTGFFLPTRTTMMAFNAIACLDMIKIPPEKILQYSSASFKKELIAKGKTINDVIKEAYDYKNYKYNYLEDANSKRYLASMLAQRGYKTIQLSNEWDGKFKRRYFIDLVDPVLSTLKLVRIDPFNNNVNTEKAHWYLNSFNKYQISDELIIKNDTEKKFDEFFFKEQCRMQGGTISITDVYLNCLRILRFGAPVQILLQENRGDFDLFPKNNQLEKLQSYFTAVYGNNDIWLTKTELELQELFDYLEIYYLTLTKKFNLTPTPKGIRRPPFYNNPGTGWYLPNIQVQQFEKRPAEQLKYVEVFRQNERFSLVEDPENFAAMYYFPVRGSGYFLPTGKLFVGKYKNTALVSVGQPPYKEPDWEQDKILARNLMYKDIDTFIDVYFGQLASEVINIRDAISSQMSLIRTHPFDPKVNEVNENIVSGDYYHSIPLVGNLALNKICIIKKMFNGKTDVICENTKTPFLP